MELEVQIWEGDIVNKEEREIQVGQLADLEEFLGLDEKRWKPFWLKNREEKTQNPRKEAD